MVEMTPDIQTSSPKEIVVEQIKHVELVGKTKIVDISPENPIDVPIIFLTGWSADVQSLGKMYEDAVKSERRIISEQYPVESLNSLPQVEIEGTTISAQTNARSMADYIESKGIERVRAIGHSEGSGIALTLVEELKRRGIKLETVVLVAPTGVGKPTASELDSGVKKMTFKKELKRTLKHPLRLTKDYLTVIKDGGKFLIKHRGKGISEGHNIAQIDMIALMENALDDGVDIGILHSGDQKTKPLDFGILKRRIPETDPFVHVADLAWDVAIAQRNRRTEAVEQIRNAIPDLLTNPDARKRFDEQVEQFIDQEESTPLVMSSPDAGHLFLDYAPGTYIPHTIEMLDYLAKQRRENPRSPKPPLMALPETTG